MIILLLLKQHSVKWFHRWTEICEGTAHSDQCAHHRAAPVSLLICTQQIIDRECTLQHTALLSQQTNHHCTNWSHSLAAWPDTKCLEQTLSFSSLSSVRPSRLTVWLNSMVVYSSITSPSFLMIFGTQLNFTTESFFVNFFHSCCHSQQLCT